MTTKSFIPLFDPRWTRSLLAIGLGVNIAATSAPPPRSEVERNAIIVQGERLPERVIEERANRFVRSTGVAAGRTPAARWIDPVCVQVQGLQDAGKRAGLTCVNGGGGARP